ncbi:MAG: Veg family protein, partial [Clostridiaceae bacterium]
MDKINVLAAIKNEIDDHIGEKVTLRANNGRRKIIVSNGILEKTYTS